MLSAWIPFHDVTPARAPLIIIDGSHKWSNTNNLRCFNNQNLDEVEYKFAHEGRKISIILSLLAINLTYQYKLQN